MIWSIIITLIVARILWSLVRLLMGIRDHLKILERVPLHREAPNIFNRSFLKKFKNIEEFFKILNQWAHESGVKMFALWFFGMVKPMYFVVQPRTMKDLLNLPVTVDKGYFIRMLKGWIGEGLLLSNGKKWKRNRRLITPAFHFDILRGYTVVFNRTVDILLDNIRVSSQDGVSVNVEPLVKAATLDALLRCALSYGETGDIQTLGKPHPYLGAIETIQKLFTKRTRTPSHFSDWIYYRSREGKEYKKMIDYVHDFADKIIATRRETLKKEASSPRKRRPDFLDILLQARDEDGNCLSELEIRSEVDTFMAAGYDNTGVIISWGINSMAKYPEEQEKVLHEIESVLEDRTDVEWKDLPRLIYLTCFIKETLRIYSSAVIISRQLTSPQRLDGIDFPAGTSIDGYIQTMHSNPQIWGDPEVFRPDRFLPENTKDMDPYAFIPFSVGSRNCIGQHFAMNELKVFLVRIIRRFRVSIDPAREAVPSPEYVGKSKAGIYVHFEERASNDDEN